MNRIAMCTLLALGACSKHEDAKPELQAIAVPATSGGIVASPTQTDTPAASASVSAIVGDAAADEPGIARERALIEAREVGMIGLLAAADDGGSPWGGSNSVGADNALTTRGNMWGDAVGDSFGTGGLGLRGTGGDAGGGGTIGLGNIGTLGHGAGTGTGQGFGTGHGRLGGSHSTNSPKIRQGAVTVNGRLPPEVIQRIVRQNFGRFRLCYENGLMGDPKLAGTVATKFVIDTTGAVTKSEREGSTTLSDAAVVQCVVRGFSNLSFPQPEGGVVIVIYPVIFAPGDAPP